MRKIIFLLGLFALFNFSIAEPSHKDKCNAYNVIGVLQLYCGKVGEAIKSKKDEVTKCILAPDVASELAKKNLGNKKEYNEIIDTLFENKEMRLTCVRNCKYGYDSKMDEIKKEIRKALAEENCDISEIFR